MAKFLVIEYSLQENYFMISSSLKNQHLMCRAAFGPMPQNFQELEKVSTSELLKYLQKKSHLQPTFLKIADNTTDGLIKGVQDLGRTEKLTREQKKQQRKQSAQDIRSLNLLWLSEMTNSEAQLREKLSLFWHGHFACRVINIFFQQQLLDVIRHNALGHFGDLLREVSKSPAMLSFLNNQQNRKQHPNENFAREVMELFTMGRGNYTESDIKESARAFTGWGFNLAGEFVDRKFAHDNGSKTFLGKTGNFDGDDIIDLILEQKATAQFITTKIYKYFVNEEVNELHVKNLADSFYASNYNIGELMENIFSSEWFYEEKNIGTHIKTPVELLVGIRRMLPMEMAKPEIQLLFQRTMGQYLFFPPNVAGWPGGKNWIDSTSLMLRMRLPQIMTMGKRFTLTPKSDDDVMMGKNQPKEDVDLLIKTDWQPVINAFAKTSRDQLPGSITRFLIQSKSAVPETILKRYADNSSRDAFIQSTVLALMSTPEYQLC